MAFILRSVADRVERGLHQDTIVLVIKLLDFLISVFMIQARNLSGMTKYLRKRIIYLRKRMAYLQKWMACLIKWEVYFAVNQVEQLCQPKLKLNLSYQ